MRRKKIFNKFKSEHPQLFKLNPRVRVDEILESNRSGRNIKYDPPLLQITVQHPFIFDNRLIPDSFDGIEVINMMVGSFPKEFPSEKDPLPLDELYSPKNYETFVDNNLDLIRQTLNSFNMTDREALDALTGDFNKHKNRCKELRINRIRSLKQK